MISEFDNLSNSEIELLLKAPIMVCLLVAGADGTIDRKEIQSAIELAKKKQRRAKARLIEFYKIVGEDFEDKLKIVMQGYPVDAAKRSQKITEELEQLNYVFPRIDREFAAELYESMKGIAMVIAESSGGLLGMKSIGAEEAKIVGLPMINDPTA